MKFFHSKVRLKGERSINAGSFFPIHCNWRHFLDLCCQFFAFSTHSLNFVRIIHNLMCTVYFLLPLELVSCNRREFLSCILQHFAPVHNFFLYHHPLALEHTQCWKNIKNLQLERKIREHAGKGDSPLSEMGIADCLRGLSWCIREI